MLRLSSFCAYMFVCALKAALDSSLSFSFFIFFVLFLLYLPFNSASFSRSSLLSFRPMMGCFRRSSVVCHCVVIAAAPYFAFPLEILNLHFSIFTFTVSFLLVRSVFRSPTSFPLIFFFIFLSISHISSLPLFIVSYFLFFYFSSYSSGTVFAKGLQYFQARTLLLICLSADFFGDRRQPLTEDQKRYIWKLVG